jgi:hypothetical protein
MTTPAWCPEPPEIPDPQDRGQLAEHCVVGSLGHLGWRPLMLTGFLRDLLTQHFMRVTNIENTELSKAIWVDSVETGILIESVYKWRGDLVEKRPAILIKRNAYRNVRVVMNDQVGIDEEGNPNYMTVWVGSHSLFCIHGTGAGTEILATEVQRQLTQFGPAISQQLDLMKFQVTEVGAISELEEATTNFVIPITLGWAYQERWRLEPEALRLKVIQLDTGNDS